MVQDWSHKKSSSHKSRFNQLKSFILLLLLFVAGIVIGLELRELKFMESDRQSQIIPALGETHFAWSGETVSLASSKVVQPKVENTQVTEAVFNDTSTPLPKVLSTVITVDKNEVIEFNDRAQREKEQALKQQAQQEKEQALKQQAQQEKEQALKQQAQREKEQALKQQAQRQKEQALKQQAQQKKHPSDHTQITQYSMGQLSKKYKGRYTLQVRAFRLKKEAIKFMNILHQKWSEQNDLYILKAMSRGRTIYRVRAGYFTQEDQAQVARTTFIKIFGSQDKPFIKEIR